jgi:hypothetical protein
LITFVSGKMSQGDFQVAQKSIAPGKDVAFRTAMRPFVETLSGFAWVIGTRSLGPTPGSANLDGLLRAILRNRQLVLTSQAKAWFRGVNVMIIEA